MVTLSTGGAYLLHGTEVVEVSEDKDRVLEAKLGKSVAKEEAAKNTMAYRILEQHNQSDKIGRAHV